MNQTADISLEQAIAHHRAGESVEAERLYRALLARQPQDATANHNLAILLAERGAATEALPFFHAALQADPAQGQYWISYAKALLVADEPADAAAILEQGIAYGLKAPVVDALLAEARKRLAPSGPDAARAALARDPGSAVLHLALGDAEAEAGRAEPAIAAYRAALGIDSGLADAWYHLGTVLSETGHISEGFAAYRKRAELVYRNGIPPPDKPHPLHRIHHDQNQRDYLAAKGLVPSDAVAGKVFHLPAGKRLPGPAINPANATPELLERWKNSWPQMVVLEDFLTPQALAGLRAYCAEATVWKRNYQAGYIGATPQDGFSCPLLAQIAEEIIGTFPEVVGPHAFRYLGAFKYDSELSTGTNTHADFSSVNVNFYIAPDEANLDPDSGGMRIWDVAAQSDAELRHYNGDEQAVREHLKNAKVTVVPHRANRAVIFKSDLFHKTDDCHFATGYLNMRINVSLLFGDRGETT